MARDLTKVNFTVNQIYVDDNEDFEKRFGKRLLTILTGSRDFDEACDKIIKSVQKEKEDSATSTKQRTIFPKSKKFKRSYVR